MDFLVLRALRNGPPISVLCFADDCLIFTQSKLKSIQTLNPIQNLVSQSIDQGKLLVGLNLGSFFPQHVKSYKQKFAVDLLSYFCSLE